MLIHLHRIDSPRPLSVRDRSPRAAVPWVYRWRAPREGGITLLELILTLMVVSIAVLAFGTSMRVLLTMDEAGATQQRLVEHGCAEALIAEYDGPSTTDCNYSGDCPPVAQCQDVDCDSHQRQLVGEEGGPDAVSVCEFTVGGAAGITIHVPIEQAEEE